MITSRTQRIITKATRYLNPATLTIQVSWRQSMIDQANNRVVRSDRISSIHAGILKKPSLIKLTKTTYNKWRKTNPK